MRFRLTDDSPDQPAGYMVPHRVDRWYDRHIRMWVVQTKDAHGNQIGDAFYGTKAGAIIEARERTAAIPNRCDACEQPLTDCQC